MNRKDVLDASPASKQSDAVNRMAKIIMNATTSERVRLKPKGKLHTRSKGIGPVGNGAMSFD